MSSFGEYYISVRDQIVSVINALGLFDQVSKGQRAEIQYYPTAWVVEGVTRLTPATWSTSIHDMEFTAVVIDLKDTLEAGLSSVLDLAGKVKDAIEGDRGLNTLVLNTEVVRYEPYWEPRGAHYRYYCGVVIVCQTKR